MPTQDPGEESTKTPKPDDDDCEDLIGEAYKAGFRDGYKRGLKLGERFCCIWWKKQFCLYFGLDPKQLKPKKDAEADKATL
jgi:hypothetical protein